MRIAVLWIPMTGYLDACLRELATARDVNLFVSFQSPVPEAPTDINQFTWLSDRYVYAEKPDVSVLRSRLRDFRPDVLLVSGWALPAYRKLCREYKNSALRVCIMDNPWKGTWKQWLGVVSAPVYVNRLFDIAFVPGERQKRFASKLGFEESCIWRGALSGDHPSMRSAYVNRVKLPATLPNRFLYLGRLAPEKGIQTLRDAYRAYRAQCPSPWPLAVAGTGPLRELLQREPGIEMLGFLQPSDVPRALREAGCLVMPSDCDHWGVAIHEGCSAGLPIICTSSCGASVHLVQDGYNGFVVAPRQHEWLARTMCKLSEMAPREREQMGDASYTLSLQFTPERWARTVLVRSLEAMQKGPMGHASRIPSKQ